MLLVAKVMPAAREVIIMVTVEEVAAVQVTLGMMLFLPARRVMVEMVYKVV